ncbi:MAG: hypothetical protein H6813_06535 [Phycisphaeraceae bacterium]|nr:hypothetical protein [Phycisphaeraceae bacterium]MCB9848129.1 hypothetical protein [Phycisphaeraceae bacterium]
MNSLMIRRAGEVASVMMCAGLAVSGARAGVEEVFWVEVDNSVGTVGAAAGEATGLDGVRTFDLYAIVSPDTRVWAADFGYVGVHNGYDDNMWTTQPIYQHEFGDDVRSGFVGFAPEYAAVEFDTYVGLGMLDSQTVMNTVILGVDWSPGLIKGAWFGMEYTDDEWIAAVGDDDGRLFLARISVASEGVFGEDTGDSEWLGGRVFLSGDDVDGDFGQWDPVSGLFLAPNAFDAPAGPAPVYQAPDEFAEPEPEAANAVFGDVNDDGVADSTDLMILQRALGSTDSRFDLNRDGIVDALDVQALLPVIGRSDQSSGATAGDERTDELAGLSPQERKQIEKAQRKAEKERLKAEKQAAKAAAKEAQRIEREWKQAQRDAEKERKRAEKAAAKARKQQAKQNKKK